MNKKAQEVGPIAFLIGAAIFVIFWAALGSSFISKWFGWGVEYNNLTGFEAFLLNNIHLWIAIFFIISIFAYFKWR